MINAIIARIEAERTEALAMLEIYCNKAVGVADHSNVVGEAVMAVKKLAEAEDALRAINTIVAKNLPPVNDTLPLPPEKL